MTTLLRPPPAADAAVSEPRWPVAAVAELFALPFADLMFRAQEVHRAHHPRNAVQLSTLLSIKTGGCPEDCGYCPQAARHHAAVEGDALLDVDTVVEEDVPAEGEIDLEGEVEEVTAEADLDEEPVAAPAAAEVPEPYEGIAVRIALVLATVILIIALPVVMSAGREVPSGLAQTIGGLFK